MNELVQKLARKARYHSYRRNNKNRDFTLICQNCLGGGIYSMLGLPFISPTINMFIEDEHFVKLAEDPVHYLSLPAEPYIEAYRDPAAPSVVYPKIRVGDIELCCLHYKSCAEAVDAWERRRKRANLNNIYVIGNSWNLHEREDLIRRVVSCGYPSLVFTFREMNIPGCMALPGGFWQCDERGIVRPNITDDKPGSLKKYFEDFFDFVSWLNGGKPEK